MINDTKSRKSRTKGSNSPDGLFSTDSSDVRFFIRNSLVSSLPLFNEQLRLHFGVPHFLTMLTLLSFNYLA